MIEASAPGKLYIAGEYAVLEPDHPAIIVALNQFIKIRLCKAENSGSIRSSQYGGLAVPWTRKNGQLMIDERENPFAYITEAMAITEKYLMELGKNLHFFDLEVLSELDNQEGKKYGLGSSGAVTVATIKALLDFYEVVCSAETIYKLAALAHLSIKSNGSFGDLAASTYGGWLAYSCFDRDWVLAKQKEWPLKKLLNTPWPKLMIQPLQPPERLHLLIGWTGIPASTTHLVDLVKEEQAKMNGFYTQFLAASKDCVNHMIQAFQKGDLDSIKNGIQANRKLLQKLSDKSGIQIETPALQMLCKIACKYNGSAKSSGAGGGDCGIVILDHGDEVQSLVDQWQTFGIVDLPLQVYTMSHEQESIIY